MRVIANTGVRRGIDGAIMMNHHPGETGAAKQVIHVTVIDVEIAESEAEVEAAIGTADDEGAGVVPIAMMNDEGRDLEMGNEKIEIDTDTKMTIKDQNIMIESEGDVTILPIVKISKMIHSFLASIIPQPLSILLAPIYPF
mmetsp:Transcript_44705/g.107869  ORF Transcript_44705/g.107869 Transcript_44705/m.107869 type:complete len:141 (-) Transcript_44705:1608-2030(-)